MSFASAQASRLLLGDFALSPKVAQASVPWSCEMLDATTLADSAKQFVNGQDTSTFAMSGFYDGDVHTDATAWTSQQPLSFAPYGFTVGNLVVIQNALRATFERGATISGLVTFDLGAQTDGATDFGLSLHDLSAETGSSTGTTIDNSASTANGAVGSLHVTAFSGFTSIDIDIRHSTDNFSGSNASLIAFTQVTGVTGEYKAATGTVNRYVRVIWTKVGTGSCTFAVGFARR